ncbi:hypothetical protein HI850_012285 [bacterium SPL81]|nr:hypothetical protein [Acinetobacter baumannii]
MSSYSICHWNTGLSPTALDTPLKDFEELTEKQRQKLAKLKARFEQKKTYIDLFLDYVLVQKNFDLIFLSEVSSKDISYFRSTISTFELDYLVIDGTFPTDSTRFDSCCIYKPSSFISILDKPESFITDDGNFNFNIALKYSFIPSHIFSESDLESKYYVDNVIDFYMCHWASKISTSGEEKRKLVSQNLHYHIRSCTQRNFIILGDFNANPYEYPIYENLKGIRCKETVIRHGKNDANILYLYNPSWKFLWFHQDTYDEGLDSNKTNPLGTYYFSTNSAERWNVFDQVLVPYTLLNQKFKWNFDCNSLKIIHLDLISARPWRKANFDHLPFHFQITER